jgi:hypothetical protein
MTLNELIHKKYEAKWGEINSHKSVKRKSYYKAEPIFTRVSAEFSKLTDDIKFPKFKGDDKFGGIEFIRPTISLQTYSDSDVLYCIDINFDTSIIRMDVDALRSNFKAGMEWLANFLAELKIDLETTLYSKLYDKYNNYRFHYPVIDGFDKTLINY